VKGALEGNGENMLNTNNGVSVVESQSWASRCVVEEAKNGWFSPKICICCITRAK